MQIPAKSPAEYINQLPEDRQESVGKLRKVILENLPKDFTETINYGMIGYVVPHSVYPAGYHVDPAQPLPFLNIASQKNFISVYHMGLFADENLQNWFVAEYHRLTNSKPDMGKSCIRFKRPEKIPYALIGELASRMTPAEWIALYEQKVRRINKP
jgi:hypothetical protein